MNIEEAVSIVNDCNKNTGNSLDVINACKVLVDYYKHCTEASEHTNKKEKFICSRAKIANLSDEIKWYISKGKITLSVALPLTRIKDKEEQWRLACAIMDYSLSEKEVRAIVNDMESGVKLERSIAELKKLKRIEKIIGVAFDSDTYNKIRREAGKRQIEDSVLCEKVINQWIKSTTTLRLDLDKLEIDLDKSNYAITTIFNHAMRLIKLEE